MSRIQALLSNLPRLLPPPPKSDNTLREFTFFSDLPPELRARIWRYAAHVPRVISLLYHTKEIDPAEVNGGSWTSNVEGQTRHPGIMQACRESRGEGSKYYELIQETALPTYRYLYLTPARKVKNAGFIEYYRSFESLQGLSGNLVYINFDTDSFVVPPKRRELDGSVVHLFPWFASQSYEATQKNFNFHESVLGRIRRLECNRDGPPVNGRWFPFCWLVAYLNNNPSELMEITFCGASIMFHDVYVLRGVKDYDDSVLGVQDARTIEQLEHFFQQSLELTGNSTSPPGPVYVQRIPVRVRVLPADGIKLNPCAASI